MFAILVKSYYSVGLLNSNPPITEPIVLIVFCTRRPYQLCNLNPVHGIVGCECGTCIKDKVNAQDTARNGQRVGRGEILLYATNVQPILLVIVREIRKKKHVKM